MRFPPLHRVSQIKQKQEKSVAINMDKQDVAWHSAIQTMLNILSSVQFSLEFGKRSLPVRKIMAHLSGGLDRKFVPDDV